jgi:hypothetical protein
MAALPRQRRISGRHGPWPVALAIELKHLGAMDLLKPGRLCCATFFKSISVLTDQLLSIPNVGCQVKTRVRPGRGTAASVGLNGKNSCRKEP